MRVLLIEDDSATAQSIELMLQSEGFNVYKTDLGEEGVDLGKIYAGARRSRRRLRSPIARTRSLPECGG
jgi:hypothetical protein